MLTSTYLRYRSFLSVRNIVLTFTLVLFTLTTSLGQGQHGLIPSDTTNMIKMDSTGYNEVHPLDISDDKGLYIYSADGQEALRFYGSFRMLTIWDDKDNFHPFDLTQPTIPTGGNDFYYPTTDWTVNMSRLGFDALVGHSKNFLIRLEFDWKGDTEKFRIRHLFLRTKHWLIGKSWSSLSNISYVIQAVDGRFSGGAVGTRQPQIRYYNSKNNIRYQFSLEYQPTKLYQSDSLVAEGSFSFPAIAAKVDFKLGNLELGFAGLVRTNHIQLNNDPDNRQNPGSYGGLVAAKYHLNHNFRVMAGVAGGQGVSSLLGDFAFVSFDQAYNGNTGLFENVGVVSGFLGIEHDWSPLFTSAFGYGLANIEAKSFFDIEEYNKGNKFLANIFYKPSKRLKNLILALEAEYADRVNIDNSINNTLRFSALVIYDF